MYFLNQNKAIKKNYFCMVKYMESAYDGDKIENISNWLKLHV